VVRIVAHFLPLRDPARQTSQRKHHREHVGRDTHRPVDDAAVEIDIRVQLAFDKVAVVERDVFQVLGNVQQRVGHAQFIQHIVGGLLEDLGARVEVLVHPMTKAHQPEATNPYPWPCSCISGNRHRRDGSFPTC
jgi:hypothetical protein